MQKIIGVIGGSDTNPSNSSDCKTATADFEAALQASPYQIVRLRTAEELHDVLAQPCAGVVVFPVKSAEDNKLVQDAFAKATDKTPIIFPQIWDCAGHSQTERLEETYVQDHTPFNGRGYDHAAYAANVRHWHSGASLSDVLKEPTRNNPGAAFAPTVPAVA